MYFLTVRGESRICRHPVLTTRGGIKETLRFPGEGMFTVFATNLGSESEQGLKV